MNPATEPPPQPPPQPHRPSTSCDRHPEESFTGFCPSCLCERLAVLDHSAAAAAASSSSRKPPTSASAAAALKAIFKPSGGASASHRNKTNNTNTNSSYFPELRRTKSFSASKNEGFSGVFEPQRKSCDVRGRSTLWSLFHQDDGGGRGTTSSSKPCWGAEVVEVETRVQGPVFESKEEEEEEEEEETKPESHREDEEVQFELEGEYDNEIRACEESNVVVNLSEVQEIEEEEEEKFEEELKPMKDHIDLDTQTKKPSRDFKEIAGSFWSAASVFSKKLQKWRQKQKLKKRRNGSGSATLPVEKPIGRQFRETQSEIADYGFGRRSCDTDPRFSLDAGRISFDDPRYSFDEPRASWDGYLIGRTFPRMPPMVSVVEDDAPVHVPRSDSQIPVEEPPIHDFDDSIPGGSAQTRDYYDSSRRRKSFERFERSSSIRKTAAAVVAEIDELKSSTSISNTKVSPAIPDRELRDSNSNSLRDDCSESFKMSFRDNGDRKETQKKSRRWSKAWSILGFIHRRGGNKDEEEDRYSRVNNGVERSLSESWPELRGEGRGGAFNRKVFRSNSSVSWRNSNPLGVSKNSLESNGNGKKRNDEFVLERNRSARYSPSSIENGLLRFYLTPLRGSRRNGSLGKSRSNHAHSIARSVLRLY